MVSPSQARNPEEQMAILIALLYRAAAEPGLWGPFLERLGVLFRANFTNVGLVTQPEQVWWFDQPDCLIREQADVNVVFQQGLSADDLRELAVRWVAVDGFSRPAFQSTVQRNQPWVSDRRSITPDEAFDRLAFCHEFALPHDYYHTQGAVVLAESRELGLFLNIHRPRRSGPFEDEEAAWLRGLLPHLRQALGVHQHWRALRRQMRGRALALDHVDRPCLTVDARGRVRWANLAADLLLEQGDGLRVQGGVVVATAPAEQLALLEALRRVGRSGRGAGPRSGETLTLTRCRAARPLEVTFLCVPPEEGQGDEVLLLLNDPGAVRLPNAQRLNQRYHLTPAESRVALALARGLTVEEIAGQGEVSVGTVRSQLKQVLSKTGTHRQGALVQLLLGLR